MTNYNVRPIQSDEFPLFYKWLHNNRELNRYEPDIFRQGRAQVFVIVNENDQPVGFVPVEFCFFLGALAPDPGAGSLTKTKVLYAFFEFIKDAAQKALATKLFVVPSGVGYSELLAKVGFEPAAKETLTHLIVKPALSEPNKET